MTARVLVDVEPDGVSALSGARAGLEANLLVCLVLEDEVVVLIEREASALAVTASALGTGGVLEDALSHAGSVDERLLRWVGGVEVELASVSQPEGGVVDVLGAGGVLLGAVDEEAAVGGLDLAVLEVGAGADGHDTEDIAGLDLSVSGSLDVRRSGDKGSGGGSDGGGSELHVDGR